MKVLFWCERYLPNIGGVEVFASALMRALKTRGFEFTMITSKSSKALPEEDEIEGVPVYRFPFHPPLYDNNLAEMARVSGKVGALKRRIGADLMHLNSCSPSVFYHLHTLKATGCPVLSTAHSPPAFVTGPRTLYGKLYRSSDWITGVSDATLQAVLRVVPDVEDKSEVVYNGLEDPGVEPAPLSFDPPHIVCVGRVVEEKGFDTAIRAFRLLHESIPSATMTIAGDGPDKSRLESLASELKISDAVNFVGWVARDDVAGVMNSGSMVVVPSTWEEPFGLVALQASQVARPVVATRVGGLPEVILDCETGLVVPPEDPESMFEAMMKLIADPDLATRLGSRGRQRAETEFSMSKCADRYERLYRRLGVNRGIERP